LSAPAPKFSQLLKNPVLMLGFGFGSGLAPKAPGTFGTLLGLVLFIPVILWSQTAAIIVLVTSLLFGNYICGKSAEIIGVHDHGGIVWDEFAGIWLVMLFLPEQTILFWVYAFVAFRIFDIWKPYPISLADRKLNGGFGIMFDDVLAAIYAIILIWVTHSFFYY
jgi:phosphatidylglycerophosphatase A